MPETISDPEELRALNGEHVRSVGKFHQMYEGISSRLTLVEDGILHLDFRVPRGYNRWPVEEIVRKIAWSWKKFSRLEGVRGFIAHVYEARVPAGFSAEVTGTDVHSLAELIRACAKAAREPGADILLTVLKEGFGLSPRYAP